MSEKQTLRMRQSILWSGMMLLTLAGFLQPARASLIDVTNEANVLPGAGRTVNVSSAYPFDASLAIPGAMIDNFATANDADGSFLFGQSDSPNRLSISGFNFGFVTLRIFTAADPTREPTSITVKSSTSLVTTLTAGDYGADLGTYSFTPLIPLTAYPVSSPPPADARGYFDINLSTPAPADTRSLYMEMTAPTSGIRIYELQALAAPEPASATCLIGVTVLFLRRKRSA